MAEPIPGFDAAQSETIHEAARRGLLSVEQKREILSRVQEASPFDPRPASLEEATGGLLRPETAEMVGGMVGGAVGATAGAAAGVPGGPPGSAAAAAGGGLVGGAVGSAAGRTAFNTTEDFLRFVGALEGEGRTPTETATEAGEAAATDIAFGGGFMAAGRALNAIGPGFAKLIGATEDSAKRAIQEAENAGLFLTVNGQRVPAVGALDVAPGLKGGALRIYSRTLGIFPFIGGPFRRSALGKAEAVIRETDNILNRLAPTATISSDLGVDMARSAKGVSEEFKGVADNLYTVFRKEAEKLPTPDILPSQPIKDAVEDSLGRLTAGKIDLGQGEVLDRALSPDFMKVMGQLKKLPDRLTVAQYESLTDRLGRLFELQGDRALSGFEVKELVKLKEAAEQAFLNPDLSRLSVEQAKKIKSAHSAANEFFAQGITKFQTPTAKKFTRVDPNFFKVGAIKPGTAEADTLAEVVTNLKSAQAIKDLSKLVGKENMGRLARIRFERAWNDAVVFDDVSGEVKGFDWKSIIKTFGMTKEMAVNRPAAKALFDEAGVPFEQVESLIRTASRIEVPRAVNQFLARRAALGGLGSAMGASTVTMLSDSMLASLGVGLVLRHMAKVFSDPIKLRAMQRIVDESIPAQQRRALLGRTLAAIDAEEAREQSGAQ